jgi:MFS family permease
MSTREPGVFTIPGFTRLLAADAISGFGSPITLLAVQSLVLLDLHGSATDVGLVSAARWLPYLVLGIVVGALVDRRRRQPIMVATDTLLGVLLLVVPVLWWLDRLTLPVLLVVMTGVGLLSLFGDAAAQSIVPRVVPGPRLQEAHARIDQSSAVAQVAGPAVAGAIVAVVGAAVSVVADAASYVVSAVLVRGIPVDEPEPVPAAHGAPLRTQVREGLAWVYRQRRLGSLAVVTHAWFVCNAMLTPVFATFVLLDLGASTIVLGAALAAAGLGSLVGASVTTRVGRRLDAGPTIILCHAITTVGITVVAVGALADDAWSRSAVVAASIVGQACHGFAMGMSNSHEMGYRQLITPDELQARTNTTMRSINRAMIIVGAPLGGVLADRVGTPTTLVVVAIGFGVVTLAGWLSPARQARYADAASSDLRS